MDTLEVDKSSRHIVVQHGSEFYSFDVLNADGTSVDPSVVWCMSSVLLIESRRRMVVSECN
jgi:hypothetical protein